MRRFEFTEGTSRKFWQIDVVGESLTVGFGRLGTQGQSKTRHCGDAAAAAQEEQSLIREKLTKGYVEVSVDAAPAATSKPAVSAARSVVSTPALKAPPAAIKVTLADRDGDPLIIRLQEKLVIIEEGSKRTAQTLDSYAAAKEHFERIVMLRKKSGATVLRTEEGVEENIPPPDIVDSPEFEGEIELTEGRWTLTFLGEPEAKIPMEVTRALVRRIAAAAPRLVHIICDFASPKQAWAKALVDVQLPSLESFVFDTHFQTQTRQSENSIGDLAAVLRACPNLQNFFATGKLTMSPVVHHQLCALHLLGTPLTAALAKGLGGCSFPALDRLILSLDAEVAPAAPEAALAALRTLAAPRLRELHVAGVEDAPKFLDHLLAQGLPPSLQLLSLCGSWRGAYDVDDIRPVLTRHADKLPTLAALGLVLADDSEVAAAHELWPCVYDGRKSQELFLPAVYQSW